MYVCIFHDTFTYVVLIESCKLCRCEIKFLSIPSNNTTETINFESTHAALPKYISYVHYIIYNVSNQINTLLYFTTVATE